tara:strand:- start:784 stop:1161 length:378 start_codon:yes stop_codon:yes gene_type:complete
MKLMGISEIYIGTDIVEILRIKHSLDKFGEKFKNHIFTKEEQKYCDEKATPEIHFSGKFAAKESVVKAIKSSGYGNITPLKKIEILNSKSGKPNVILKFNISGHCKVSISHTGEYATAMALFMSK